MKQNFAHRHSAFNNSQLQTYSDLDLVQIYNHAMKIISFNIINSYTNYYYINKITNNYKHHINDNYYFTLVLSIVISITISITV